MHIKCRLGSDNPHYYITANLIYQTLTIQLSLYPCILCFRICTFLLKTPFIIITRNKFMYCELIILCRICILILCWFLCKLNNQRKWIKLPIQKGAYNCWLTNFKMELKSQSFLRFSINLTFWAPQLFRFWVIRMVRLIYFIYLYQDIVSCFFDPHGILAQFNIRRKLNFRILEFKWEKSWEIIWIVEHAMYNSGQPVLRH